MATPQKQRKNEKYPQEAQTPLSVTSASTPSCVRPTLPTAQQTPHLAAASASIVHSVYLSYLLVNGWLVLHRSLLGTSGGRKIIRTRGKEVSTFFSELLHEGYVSKVALSKWSGRTASSHPPVFW